MELRHLRYMVAVAEELHFGRAAARLNVSQPPLSRQVRDLEQELGVVLFERTKRRVRLTPAGEAFLHDARLVLAGVERTVRHTRLAAEGRTGRLSIGFVEAVTHSGLLPLALESYRARFPEVVVELAEIVSKDQPAALREGRIDVGFAFAPPRGDGFFEVESVLSDRLLLATPQRLFDARRSGPTPADLRGATLLLFRRELAPALHDAVREAVHRLGIAPGRQQEFVQMHTALGLVAAGMGVTLLPESMAGVARPGVRFTQVKGLGVRFETHLVWRQGDPSPCLPAFLDAVRAAARRLGRAPRARPAGPRKPA
jgi:DNA-binding transcriptional LysR family regulator